MKLPKNWIGVRFFDLDAENPSQGSCLITSESQCKSKVELSALRAAIEVEDTVCMGRLICKPEYAANSLWVETL